VRSDPDDAALVEDHDPIGVKDRAHALRDDDDVRITSLGVERPAQASICRRVQCGEAVVEEVDRRALHQRAGDREALPLPAGNVGAALVDRGLELAVHGRDEVTRLRDLECVPQLLVGRVRVAESQVVGHGALEQVGGLRHETDAAP
jgi:hypothetical protein